MKLPHQLYRTPSVRSSKQLSVPKLNIGKHAFSVVMPTILNEFPIAIKSSETTATFRKKLKTCLFETAFPP